MQLSFVDNVNRRLITDLDELRSLVSTWFGKDFAFDVETSGLSYRKDRLLGLALYFEDGNAFYIALAHTMPFLVGAEYYHHTFITTIDFARVIKPLFDQDVLMVAHNAKFDMHFLHRLGIFVHGHLADTLLAAQLLDENRENDLKSLASSILGFSYDKYQTLVKYKGFKSKEILGVPLEDVAQYAMNDVEATFKLYPIFTEKLQKEAFRDTSLLDVYNNVWMPLCSVLQQMEARGIALDIELVQQMHVQYTETVNEYERRIQHVGLQMILDRYDPTNIPSYYTRMATEEEVEAAYENVEGRKVVDVDGLQVPIITYDMIGKTKSYRPRILTFNTGSPKQMSELIYEYTNFDLPDHVQLKPTESGDALAVDKDNLETIVFYNGNETPQFIHDALVWKKASKFLTTYLDRFLEDADPNDYNSISTNFNQDVAKTGRLSSSSPNLQNIPSRGEVGKQARSMFVARPGHKLVVADLGQAELRMLAHYSMDKELLLAFEENRDLHILTGAGFARISYEELYERYHSDDFEAKQLRMLGKTGNFALTYGMGPQKFQRYLLVNNKYEVSIEQAKEWIEGYNDKYAGATKWKEQVRQFIHKNGYVVTFGGRKRRLPEIWSRSRKEVSYAERQGINAVIQGSVGDIMYEAMIPTQKALLGLGGTLLLQVHDELVAEVPTPNAMLAKTIMEDYMVRECNKKLRVPQVADAKIGISWGDAKG